MLYEFTIEGESPLLMHSSAGLDPQGELNVELRGITAKRGTNRTEPDDLRAQEIETLLSIWWDDADVPAPTIPPHAIRATIETGARKLKQGPMVREGLVVLSTDFHYDTDKYGIGAEKLALSTQFRTPVVVQRNRIMRTRAKFDCPWSCTIKIDGDDDLVSAEFLGRWIDIAGRRIGLGDWRPEKSGSFGRFSLAGNIQAG